MSRAWQAIVGKGSALALVGAVAACGHEPPAPPPPRDPVIAAVLNDPLMTDPDLLGQAQPGAVFTLNGPAAVPIPLIDRSTKELTAIRVEATRSLGGAAETLPEPAAAVFPPADATLAQTASHLLAALRGAPGCAAGLGYGAGWGAQLPAAVPIIPRGHLLDGAGREAPGCRLRAVTFLTPLPADEALAFYWTRARQAGFDPRYERSDPRARILGGAAGRGFLALVEGRDEGTAVTLVTAGL
ncbi:hypothetical protein ACFOON_09405 [Novosphingobium piscinae]|uniref:Uncharacterized protein n=1 Tax=Novosphingobium piscinae TaxID=1507448 RepID=A0A7X1KR47_9SPHN|nr:hypothetical protein [Novosphingobium piscinae]MBC2670409.1 hypothetical protein [Novosphingobium piscinae]